MADGDLAALAGLDVFSGTQDRRDGWNNDNIRGDDIARHMLDGTHDFDHITGTASPDQIPALDGSKIGSGTVPVARIPSIPISKLIAGDFPAGFGMITNRPIATTTTMNAGAGFGVGGTGYGIDGFGNVGCQAITSAYTRGNPVTGWVSLGIDGSGRIGPQASVRRSKQNIKPWLISLETFMGLEPKTFRYRSEVRELRKAGQEAPYEVGFIADDFESAGLEELVYRDAESGELAGLHYERLVVPLWGIVQQQQQLIDALTERVATLEGQTNG